MLDHLRQAQVADQGRPLVARAADAQDTAGSPCKDALAEVDALLDAYGVPRAFFCVLGPDWRAQEVPARLHAAGDGGGAAGILNTEG